MELFESALARLYSWVWGLPLLFFLFGAGVYLTFVIKGLQFRYCFYAVKLLLFPPKEEESAQGDLSHFQALMTALAGSIGVGTIAGVGTALSIGGLGAIFWMVVVGFVGMAIKYAEALLAIFFRESSKEGVSGGPMYYLEKGLGWKKLALLFAFFGVLSALSTGNMVQGHSVEEALNQFYSIEPWIVGVGLSFIVGIVVLGGVQSIGAVASILVPLMALGYLIATFFVLSHHLHTIPSALLLILKSALQGEAAVGGVIGSTVVLAVQEGVSKGIFSTGAGLGGAAFCAATARTSMPVRQAIIAMMGAFFSMCLVFLTGLVIAVSDIRQTSQSTGAPLTIEAYSAYIPGGEFALTIILLFFAYSTILACAYYGEQCFSYLLGKRYILIYRIIFTLMVIPGTMFSLQVVWYCAGIMSGLMVIPNLLGILGLSGLLRQETQAFIVRDRKPSRSQKKHLSLRLQDD